MVAQVALRSARRSMSALPREARSYVWRVAFAIFKVRDRLCADEREFQGRALWGWREQHVVVFGDYDIMSVLGKVRCGAHCLHCTKPRCAVFTRSSRRE